MVRRLEIGMRILLRILLFGFFVWLICYSFYSLGRKKALSDEKQKGQTRSMKRKKVESTVIENDSNDSCSNDKE